MSKVNNKITNLNERNTVELRPGLFKTNLSYNDDTMLCYFKMKKGCVLPLPQLKSSHILPNG